MLLFSQYSVLVLDHMAELFYCRMFMLMVC